MEFEVVHIRMGFGYGFYRPASSWSLATDATHSQAFRLMVKDCSEGFAKGFE